MKGRIAVVTGANRGLGLETCRQLGRKGFRVVLTSRNETQGQRGAQSLSAEKLDVSHVPLDVTDGASISALAERLKRDDEAIDVLVNNAGVALGGFNAEVARRTLAVNLFGTMQVTDALLPMLSKHASIVMVSSGLGELSCLSHDLRAQFEHPVPDRTRLRELMESLVGSVAAGRHQQDGWPSSAYRVSKVGLNAFTRILAAELVGTGVLVNAVGPGWVQTNMGGPGATRTIEEGARGITWAATLPADGPTGGFFRDGEPIPW